MRHLHRLLADLLRTQFSVAAPKEETQVPLDAVVS
jgi:hypothetical protein